jgi:hypothetical protein
MSLACSPILPSVPAMSFDKGSSLTVLRLFCSLCLQPKYNNFRSRLEQFLPLLDGSMLPTTNDKMIDAALKVLQRAEVEKEDHDEMDDGIKSSAADQDVNMVDDAGQPRALVLKVDNALKILVANATEEFGFAPRDVYNGVLDLPGMTNRRDRAVDNLKCTELANLVRTFTRSRELDEFSHRVVAVYPVIFLPHLDKWEINFKSIRIAGKMVEKMQLVEDQHLRHTYRLLHETSEGSNLAGWIFKAIVHCMLSDGWRLDGPAPQPLRMISNERDPPGFSTDPSPPDPLLSSLAPLCAGTRTVTRVYFTHPLSNVTLDNDKYYIPTTANHPLFDSFTVDLDLNRVVISVFQITLSPRHEGSAKGYPRIRKIMTRVHELLKERDLNATVKVAYFLVCPEDGSQHQWQMPIDWNMNAKANDHHGNAFCVCVPT